MPGLELETFGFRNKCINDTSKFKIHALKCMRSVRRVIIPVSSGTDLNMVNVRYTYCISKLCEKMDENPLQKKVRGKTPIIGSADHRQLSHYKIHQSRMKHAQDEDCADSLIRLSKNQSPSIA